MTTRPDTQSASLNPSGRLRARLGLQVKRMLGRLASLAERVNNKVLLLKKMPYTYLGRG